MVQSDIVIKWTGVFQTPEKFFLALVLGLGLGLLRGESKLNK